MARPLMFFKALQRLVPHSLLGRMLLLTLLAVLLAQGVSSLFWISHLRASRMEGLLNASRSLGYSIAASVRYFSLLPPAYRPVVLEQLRNMGGTRFFVSLNEKPLIMEPLPDSPGKQAVLHAVESVLRERLGNGMPMYVEFVSPKHLRLFNGNLSLDELPRSWAHYVLSFEPLDPPILVTQIRIGPEEWVYIGTLMPAPYLTLDEPFLPLQQAWFILFSSAFLLLFIGLLIHWQSRPLKRLSQEARELSLEAQVQPLPEVGASEIQEVTRAFNTMRDRISRYLAERGQLFSAISHDLRTPITRLRLRAELLEDEALQARFNRDLDELDLLVKGALQCVKDTDIHENIESVDLNLLLSNIVEPYQAGEQPRATLQGEAVALYPGKPLALKRCIGNVLDNALKYGNRAHLTVEDDGKVFMLHVDDEGPGVPEKDLEQVFEPHVRLTGQQQGYGLGLGIARNLAHAHGGEVVLRNRREGGLRVTLTLPR
ncbi:MULTISPECIES: ATP-binding protein [Pseudomonas]|uniref:histidine kinase n=1 Tax=Pseudomonas lutea TaxID=243924 RepID=A0A9X8ME05_9PSED|nr:MULTISPECIES: ATP-binding protein [Pseudomonas]MCG7371782.1 ATP-binding protein [Pseudomonas luteola]SEQ78301.1 Signal transduction histidine kinase [Pseudomonas lutea]